MNKKSGLTLMEVMLVIAFLAIVFPPLLQMFSRSFLISLESEMSLKAISIAEKEMEKEKHESFSNLLSATKEALVDESGFMREITVVEPDPNLKDVAVRIYYIVGNSELSISLKTLVANF